MLRLKPVLIMLFIALLTALVTAGCAGYEESAEEEEGVMYRVDLTGDGVPDRIHSASEKGIYWTPEPQACQVFGGNCTSSSQCCAGMTCMSSRTGKRCCQCLWNGVCSAGSRC